VADLAEPVFQILRIGLQGQNEAQGNYKLPYVVDSGYHGDDCKTGFGSFGNYGNSLLKNQSQSFEIWEFGD